MLVGSLVFLTPFGALVALVAVFPLAGLALAASRERRGREALGLPPPPPARRLTHVIALAAVPLLLGFAAAQPALRTTTSLRVRTDAEAFFVLDTSRSMLAAHHAGAPTRLARAKAGAIRMREEMAEVPSGVGTLTDRVLPNLLPNADSSVFRNTVQQAVGIEQPPPATTDVVATDLGALGAVATQSFFSPPAARRLVVVFTDGESRPFDPRQVAHGLATRPGVHLILVRLGTSGEAVYLDGKPESGYHPDAASGQALAALASAAGGEVFDEQSLNGAIRDAKAELGFGPTLRKGTSSRTRTLAPYVILASLVPLLVIVGPATIRALRVLAGVGPESAGRRRMPRRPRLRSSRDRAVEAARSR